ncbi:MAG: hypothetical protein KJ868_07545, partial [Gammaproteobacteria bacterium]|nr:hypothetical protein [Gammaproteobacteria bacterium]
DFFDFSTRFIHVPWIPLNAQPNSPILTKSFSVADSTTSYRKREIKYCAPNSRMFIESFY